ncbi:MAG: hypothetical protein SFY96_11935 [Planctomycetota bacterium]|nr:hypothetical protein [Planctomycetota bacterium]
MNTTRPSTPPTPAPLWAVQVLTFLGSVGTAVLTNGVYFLTKHAYAFDTLHNYILAIVLGVTYIVGSAFAGRIVEALNARGVCTRTTLAATLVLLGVVCFWPPLVAAMSDDPAKTSWTIWPMVAIYSPLTGLLWPIVESYLSGGRRGDELRSAVGWWNVVWSSAGVLGWWAMGPLVEKHALAMMAALGVVHIVTAVTLLPLPRVPAAHVDEEHDPHPPVYRSLLTTFRMLLPLSYVFSTVLGPYLPEAMKRLGVSAAWAPPLAATWQAARVLTFFSLPRWHGWHGRWSTPIAGGVMLLTGFSMIVLQPHLLEGTAGLMLVLAGLALQGTGMATIYTGALYYALEVGNADVDAGGTHEALIGLGYTVGPLCGLAPALAVQQGWLAAGRQEFVVLGSVAAIAGGVSIAVVRRVHRESSAK